MKLATLALVLLAPFTIAAAQPGGVEPAPRMATDQLPRHLVMITRAGPNFDRRAEFRAESRAHQALWARLAAEGHTIAGGAFDGQPVMGMTIFSRGIDEAAARKLMAEDLFPRLGITTIEFRTLIVVNGKLPG